MKEASKEKKIPTLFYFWGLWGPLFFFPRSRRCRPLITQRYLSSLHVCYTTPSHSGLHTYTHTHTEEKKKGGIAVECLIFPLKYVFFILFPSKH